MKTSYCFIKLRAYIKPYFFILYFLLPIGILAPRLNCQSGTIPDVLFAEAYTNNFSPTVGCDEFSLCLSMINFTDPYETFSQAIIQLHVNLDRYEIIDPGVFVNTNQTNSNGETIFETTQEIMSINDPNWSGPADGAYRFCIQVRGKSTVYPKNGFHVYIDLNSILTLDFDSGFINIFTIINEIGEDINSVTNLSDVAINTGSTEIIGLLFHPVIACNGFSSQYEPQSFVIHGTLVVDRDYCFFGTIYMDEGAIIKINPGVICNLGWDQSPFITSRVDACGKMWREILVEPEALLVVKKTNIENGLYGTRLNYGNLTTSSDVKYLNNYIGIKGMGFANLNSTEFDFSGSFRPDCSGCSGLRIYDRTYAGIDLESSTLDGSQLSFSSLMNGVRTYHSKVNLDDGSFSDIQDYGTNDYSMGNTELYNGKAVHVAGKPSTTNITNSDFESCNWGIYSKGVNCNAKFNEMESVYTGIQVDLSPGRTINIDHNNIEAYNRGINLSWSGVIAPSDVSENEITLLNTNSIGIDLNEVHGLLTTVHDNTILIGQGIVGINAMSSNNNAIAYNIVSSTSTSTQYNLGIKLEGGTDNWIVCNLLNSVPGCTNTGLSLVQSPNNVTVGNDAYGWNFDMQYVGTCAGSVFSNNTMNDSNHGLCLGIPNLGNIAGALIGTQEHMANKWVGSYSGKAAKHYGMAFDRIGSMFTVNTQDQQHPEYTPENFLELQNDNWFLDQLGTGVEILCPNGAGSGDHPREFPREEDYLIAQDSFDYGEDAGSRIWTAKRQLYREIEKQEQLDSLPEIFQNFYQEYKNTTVGKFERVEQLVALSFSNISSYQQNIEDNIIQSDSLTTIYMQYSDSLTISIDSTEQAALMMQLSFYKSLIDSLYILRLDFIEEMKDTTEYYLTLANNVNAAIQTDTTYETNQQLINEIMISKLLNCSIEFDSTEQAQITEIASQCSMIGGEAVYRARAMHSLYSPIVFRDDTSCVQALAERSGNSGRIKDAEPYLIIYPNPVVEYVHYVIQGDQSDLKELSIADVWGRTLIRIQNEEMETSGRINVQFLEPGYHILTMESIYGSRHSYKFIKM